MILCYSFLTALGDPLTQGLTDVAKQRPADPIAHLAKFLHNFTHAQIEGISSPKISNRGGVGSAKQEPTVRAVAGASVGNEAPAPPRPHADSPRPGTSSDPDPIPGPSTAPKSSNTNRVCKFNSFPISIGRNNFSSHVF